MEINFPIYDNYLKLIFGMGHMQQDERCSASQCVSMNSFLNPVNILPIQKNITKTVICLILLSRFLPTLCSKELDLTQLKRMILII